MLAAPTCVPPRRRRSPVPDTALTTLWSNWASISWLEDPNGPLQQDVSAAAVADQSRQQQPKSRARVRTRWGQAHPPMAWGAWLGFNALRLLWSVLPQALGLEIALVRAAVYAVGGVCEGGHARGNRLLSAKPTAGESGGSSPREVSATGDGKMREAHQPGLTPGGGSGI